MMNKVLLMAAVMVATCASFAEDGTLTVEKFTNEVHRTIMDHIYVNGVRRK